MKPDRNSRAYKFGRFLGYVLGVIILCCAVAITVAGTFRLMVWILQ